MDNRRGFWRSLLAFPGAGAPLSRPIPKMVNDDESEYRDQTDQRPFETKVAEFGSRVQICGPDPNQTDIQE